jgi:phosphate transport system permease protein
MKNYFRKMITASNWKLKPSHDQLQSILGALFGSFNFLGALSVTGIVLFCILVLFQGSWPILLRDGISNIVKLSIINNSIQINFPSTWYIEGEIFGVAAFVTGTVVTSVFSLLLAFPISIGTALFINEFIPQSARKTTSFFFQLFAAVPSVIFGLWGIYVLAPFISLEIVPKLAFLQGIDLSLLYIVGLGLVGYKVFQSLRNVLRKKITPKDCMKEILTIILLISLVFYVFGLLTHPPLLKGAFFNVFTSILILIVMITPIITTISYEIIAAVPNSQREAMFAVGATSWETTRLIVLPLAKRGIFGASILGYARAIGETMAITMTIGNSNYIFRSIFDPGSTLASVIAAEYGEASASAIRLGALMELGLLLFITSIIVNMVARIIIGKSATASARFEV